MRATPEERSSSTFILSFWPSVSPAVATPSVTMITRVAFTFFDASAAQAIACSKSEAPSAPRETIAETSFWPKPLALPS